MSEMTNEQLTRAVAEEVMGWKIIVGSIPLTFRDSEGNLITVEQTSYPQFNPLHRPDHWWMVALRMRELGWWFRLLVMSSSVECEFYKLNGDCEYASGFETGRIILEAALAAVWGKE